MTCWRALPLLGLAACTVTAPPATCADGYSGSDGVCEPDGTPGPYPDEAPELEADRPADLWIGGDRLARVVVPDGGTAGKPTVLLLGGYFNFGWELDAWVHASALVRELGFVLVVPDGRVDTNGAPFWNATDTCCDYDETGVDDVAYLTGLVDELVAEHGVDPDRVTALGHSNGAFMAYRLACEPTNPLSALASIAGSSWLDPAMCDPAGPVSVLQIHGSRDQVMPAVGDDEAPGALEVLERWATRNGCVPESRSFTGVFDYDSKILGAETVAVAWQGCPADLAVEFWWMTGATHYPDFNAAFTHDAISWLLDH